MFEFTIVRKKELRELTRECEAGIEIYNNSESDKCTFFEPGFKISSDLNKLPDEFIGEYEITDWEGYRAYFKYAKKSPLKFEGKRLLVLYHELYTECQDAFERGFRRVDRYKLKKLEGYDNVLVFGIKKGDICIYENADELLSEDLDDLKDFFFGDYKIFNSEDLIKMFGKEYERKGKSLVILFGQGYNFNTGKYLYDEIEHKWGGKREGAGRPEKNRGRMTLWLDEETKSLLEKEAERTKESRSDVINRILKEAIKS